MKLGENEDILLPSTFDSGEPKPWEHFSSLCSWKWTQASVLKYLHPPTALIITGLCIMVPAHETPPQNSLKDNPVLTDSEAAEGHDWWLLMAGRRVECWREELDWTGL